MQDFVEHVRHAYTQRNKDGPSRDLARAFLRAAQSLAEVTGPVDGYIDKPFSVVDWVCMPDHKPFCMYRRGFNHPAQAFRMAKRRLRRAPKVRGTRTVFVYRDTTLLRSWRVRIGDDDG